MSENLKWWWSCALLLGVAAWAAPATAQIVWPQPILTQVVAGLTDPVHIANAGDGSGRLFIVERAGRIRIYQNGSLLSTPFLDISSKTSVGGERGLLSVAFPPGYETTGRFYVFYTQAVGGDLVIARYRLTANPNVADPLSEEILLLIDHSSASNHNGGQLAFSPTDGYLYISTGDGGNTPAEAQNLSSLLGKLLRIDVESGGVPYTIPPDNPFLLTGGARQELWARGFRNPWRFAFDRANGDLYLADVGQASWEEVDVQRDTSLGGENYGWNIMEGLHCYQVTTCNQAGLTLPVLEYSSAGSDCAIMGGVVYRGTVYPRMQGVYFYADYCSGKIWGLQHDGAAWQSTLLTTFNQQFALTSFGEGEDGSVYFTDSANGAIYQITDTVAATGADLRVTLGASPSPATVGQAFTLTATVTNLGPGSATGVALTETLASGPSIGAITPSQGTCSPAGQTVTCALGTLNSGMSATVSVVLTPSATGTLTNSANVSATQSDPNMANNSASLQTTVLAPSADLAVAVSDSPDPVSVNGTITYTVTATNNGPSAATGVTMIDSLPSEVSFVSAAPSQGSCSGTSTVTCTVGSLSISSTVTITIQATAPSTTGALSSGVSVSASQPDPASANNTATISTTVEVPSPLVNLSTRGAVVSAPGGLLNGGFIIGPAGSGTKQVLIRARGPSMGGAPFFVPGTLTNPTMRLVSAGTTIAQNDNWPLTDPLCLSPATACASGGQITDTGKDPCQPNPGQTGAPPGCTQEAALLVTLPPGPYSVVISGVGGSTGIALVEVFDVDTGSLLKLINISTRGTVVTAPGGLLNGGFVISSAGSGTKQVLIRARGPSMGGAPFFVPGTLANPTMRLVSAGTTIAQNDTWLTTDPLCLSPAIACGDTTQITATGKSPCVPNPGQGTTAPPGCTQEAALLVTLPPGPYNIVVSGVGGTTGVALVEVFEISP